METLNSPLKWHGGKSPYADWIVSLLPDRARWFHYVEPYFGGGSVLFAKPYDGYSEVVNDKSLELSRFWKVMQGGPDGVWFDEFVRRITATPVSQLEYTLATPQASHDIVDVAVNLFIRARQSMAGRMQEFTPLTRNRLRRDMNEQASAWWSAIAGLESVHARLGRVVILDELNAISVIRNQDGQHTIFYLDPPYLFETRVTTGEYGMFEMSHSEHLVLLQTLDKIKGRFMLSGYHSKLYDEFAASRGWSCVEYAGVSHAGSSDTKDQRIECVWRNYELSNL